MRAPKHTDEFEKLDRMDEKSIIEQMQGGLIEERYAYSFQSRGDLVVGLSAAGMQRIAQTYGAIHVELVEFKDIENEYIVICKAEDKARDLVMLGAAQQSKTQGGAIDKFAVPKVVTKAQRNALRGILPVPLVEKLLKVYIEGKKNKERETKIHSILQRVNDFGYSVDKFNKWIEDEYKVNELQELTDSQLVEVQRFVLSSKAKSILSLY